MLLFTFKISDKYAAAPLTIPTRQPAMLKDLLKEFNSNATSLAPWYCKILFGASFKIKL